MSLNYICIYISVSIHKNTFHLCGKIYVYIYVHISIHLKYGKERCVPVEENGWVAREAG